MFRIFFKRNFGISLLVFLSLLIILNNFFRFFQNKTLYQFLPWLSNYQGGFTRRGLPGELFFQMYDIFNIHLGWSVLIFVSFLYCIFYFSFLYLLKDLRLNKLLVFSIFSPLSFYFPVLNSKASGHKEIIFLSLLSIFCCILPKVKKVHANYIMLGISVFVILSHDGLLFYLTYLIIPFLLFYDFKNFKELFLNFLPIVLTVFSLTLLIYLFNGSEQHVNQICDSIQSYSNEGCREAGQIAFLKHNIEYNILSRDAVKVGNTYVFSDYFKIYGIGFIFGFMPLIILYKKSKILNSVINYKIHPLIFLFFPLVLSSPIYYMAADWGRYLFISYISSLIIIIFCFINKILIFEKNKIFYNDSKIKKFIFSFIVFIYCLGWTVPICCEKDFKLGIFNVINRIINYTNI